MPESLVIVGTNDVWSPPRRIRLRLTDEFFIENENEVSWQVAESGCITRIAILSQGRWRHVKGDSALNVIARAGDDASIGPGGLRFRVALGGEIIPDPTQPALEGSQRELSRPRRLLPRPRRLLSR